MKTNSFNNYKKLYKLLKMNFKIFKNNKYKNNNKNKKIYFKILRYKIYNNLLKMKFLLMFNKLIIH